MRASRRGVGPAARIGRTGVARPGNVPCLVAGLALLMAAPAMAQDRLFPDRALLPVLLAGPRDPATLGQLTAVMRDPTRLGAGPSGDVAVSGALPLVLLAGESARDGLVLGIEGAVFARFSFTVVEREMVNTDWLFTVPLVWHRGDHWLRLRYLHTSSHLGDEYANRFDVRAVNFSRDGADLTGYARLHPALGLYALAFWSANSHPVESRRWHVRGGVELDPYRRAAFRPYWAADIQLEQDNRWAPRLAAQAGTWLPSPQGRPLRLVLELLTGPTPMGQFHGRHTTHVALALVWNP
jgi:hypothetical protein